MNYRFLSGLLLAILLAASPRLSADDLTRAAQEALRTRELYYGDVDGIRTPETTEAIRRFQEKKGLDPTGALDETTRRALGLIPQAAGGPVEESRDFIDRYLHACQGANLDEELAFYAGTVNYMDEGPVRKDVLRTELSAYRQNWPARRFKLLHCVASSSPSAPADAIVTFRYQFDVGAGPHERKGIEDITAILRSGAGGLRIISIRQI